MKIVEGQLDFLNMVYDLSSMSRSRASANIRQYIDHVRDTQEMFPDVLPKWLGSKYIENAAGRLVSADG